MGLGREGGVARRGLEEEARDGEARTDGGGDGLGGELVIKDCQSQ